MFLNSFFNTISINFVDEDRKPSLPSSPFLKMKDNISLIPDGEFSREKEKNFEIQIKRLITPLRFNPNIYGQTLLERKIYEKRYNSILSR
jgi:hypothetical protein